MRTLPTFGKVNETPDSDKLLVFLDGVEQRYVIEYDTEVGYLIRYAIQLQPDGEHFAVFKVAGDEVVAERLEGVVTLAWKEPVA